MQKRTLYTCEYCHTDYADEKKALECEMNHKLLKDAVEITEVFSPIRSDSTGCPRSIRVKFKGCSEYITYKR